jgi:hypothetical protein
MAGQRVNIVLDEERSVKLRRLAERTHTSPGTLARSLLSTALDDADHVPVRVMLVDDQHPAPWTEDEPVVGPATAEWCPDRWKG